MGPSTIAPPTVTDVRLAALLWLVPNVPGSLALHELLTSELLDTAKASGVVRCHPNFVQTRLHGLQIGCMQR